MQITFLGGAQEVTGSSYLVDTGAVRFLVDCGMFQGGRSERERNQQSLDIDLERLDFVLITHAHLDHCGLLPVLVRRGFRGPVYATKASAELMAVMLADSAHILEKEAVRASALTQSTVRPLYTVVEAERAMHRVHGVRYDDTHQAHRTVQFRFLDAGHILGAAIVEVWVSSDGGTRKLVFSGDLGQPARPVVRDPTAVAQADVLLIESTYGNRSHRSMPETIEELVTIINDTLYTRRGNVIVPAFAVGRTQELIAILVQQAEAGRLRGFDVFVDSPLATRATEITLRHQHLLDEQSRAALQRATRDRLPIRIHFIEHVEDSKRLNAIAAGAVIIAGSGMCDGGRIKHHLAYNLHRAECAVLFSGFQARGTLGRRIVDRATSVRIHGREVAVRASVHTLGGLSAHADRDALLNWARNFTNRPERVFVIHGEAETAAQFATTLARELRWPATAPQRMDCVEL